MMLDIDDLKRLQKLTPDEFVFKMSGELQEAEYIDLMELYCAFRNGYTTPEEYLIKSNS